MSPLIALNDACRALCGEKAIKRGMHDDACLELRQVLTEWAALRLAADREASA